MPHLSVISPVYQSADCLAELHRRLVVSLEQISSDFEIVLVDDGSTDESWKVIQSLARADSRVKGYRFSRNFGQHYGITAGLDLCDGDWVVVMDCDLQDRPEDIPRLYAKAMSGFDVVLGRRRERHDHPVRRLVSRGFYRLFAYLTEEPYDGAVGNFRIISRAVAENTRHLREQARYFGGLVGWLGFDVTSVEVQNDPRFAGQSTYTFRQLVRFATSLIFAYSDKPLRLTVGFGLVVSAFAVAFGVAMMVRALVWGIPVSGWASLIVSMYMLGGIMIGLIGMVGIYLARVFDESKRRPLYIVRESTRHGRHAS